MKLLEAKTEGKLPEFAAQVHGVLLATKELYYCYLQLTHLTKNQFHLC